jgi:hypothetical protein
LENGFRIALKVRKWHAAILPNEKRMARHASALICDKIVSA